jgi:hypothetical protein
MRVADDTEKYHNLKHEKDPETNCVIRLFKKEYAIQLNKDPTMGMWLFLCDMNGNKTDLASSIAGDLLIWVDGLKKENTHLKILLATLNFKYEGIISKYEYMQNKQISGVKRLSEAAVTVLERSNEQGGM